MTNFLNWNVFQKLKQNTLFTFNVFQNYIALFQHFRTLWYFFVDFLSWILLFPRDIVQRSCRNHRLPQHFFACLKLVVPSHCFQLRQFFVLNKNCRENILKKIQNSRIFCMKCGLYSPLSIMCWNSFSSLLGSDIFI